MNDALAVISQTRVLPAVVIDDVRHAEPLGQAMMEGGLPCVEVTFRTPAAAAALRAMTEIDGLCVGAGTITHLRQLDEAMEAGASFVVTPGLDETLIRQCQEAGVPIIPGAVTPTELMRAINLGLEWIKFFPCSTFGGLPAIQNLSGPFPNLQFLPTGGIDLSSLSTYLAHPQVLACGGTWMARREWIREGCFNQVRETCLETMSLVANVG